MGSCLDHFNEKSRLDWLVKKIMKRGFRGRRRNFPEGGGSPRKLDPQICERLNTDEIRIIFLSSRIKNPRLTQTGIEYCKRKGKQCISLPHFIWQYQSSDGRIASLVSDDSKQNHNPLSTTASISPDTVPSSILIALTTFLHSLSLSGMLPLAGTPIPTPPYVVSTITSSPRNPSSNFSTTYEALSAEAFMIPPFRAEYTTRIKESS